MMPLKKLVAERKKLEAEVGEEVRAEKKVVSVKEGAKFEKQMIRQEKAKIRHLKIEKRIGKYARKGMGVVQKVKGAVKTGRKIHKRVGKGLGVMQGIAGQFEKGLQPPKGMGGKKEKRKKGGAFGFDLPF